LASPIWLLSADSIAFVGANPFEDFCYELLDYEVGRRHVGARIFGPPRKYRQDGGMDMRVEIVAAPKIPFADFDAALTDDALRNTTVACKSGASWREKLLEDATKSKPLEVVAEGGHFMGMVNLKLAPSEAEDIRTDIVKQISKKLGLPEDEIDTRVRLYDANSLARFYAYNPVVLSRDLRDAFHLPLLNGLFDYPEWLVFQGKQRGWPEFAADGLRKDALDDLNLILNRPGGGRRASPRSSGFMDHLAPGRVDWSRKPLLSMQPSRIVPSFPRITTAVIG
jgi:hypothetical protein